MSYSTLSKSLLASVVLSACAHGASAPITSVPTAPSAVERAGSRQTDGPVVARMHSAYLASEARPQQSVSTPVVVEYGTCEVWSQEQGTRCDLSPIANHSIAPGYRATP